MAEILGTKISNSAYHGTRLDVEHVAQTVNEFVTEMEKQWGIDRHQMAPDTVFVSLYSSVKVIFTIYVSDQFILQNT